MNDDLVFRRAVLDSLVDEYNKRRQEGGLKLAWIELAVNRVEGLSIVTCGECVHCIRQYGWPSDPEPELWCDGRGWPRLMVIADDFCSRGKKGAADACTV